MLDLDQVDGFEWDDGNDRKNEDRHRVSNGEAEQVFFSLPLLVLEDVKHSEKEPRFHALGRTDMGRLLHVTFTVRQNGKKIRVISARDMHRKEKVIYEEKAEGDS